MSLGMDSLQFKLCCIIESHPNLTPDQKTWYREWVKDKVKE